MSESDEKGASPTMAGMIAELLRREFNAQNEKIAKLTAELAEAKAKANGETVQKLQSENSTLRWLLGNSAKDCVHCGLAAEDQAKCARGFPGCARADDQALSKHFADAFRADQAEAEREEARRLVEALEARVSELMKSRDGYYNDAAKALEHCETYKIRVEELERELRDRHERLLKEGDYYSLHARVDEIIERARTATGSTNIFLQRRVIEGALWSGLRATDELRKERDRTDRAYKRITELTANVAKVEDERGRMIDRLTAKLETAKADVLALLEDSKRLNWLEQELEREAESIRKTGTVSEFSLFRRNSPITRASIDEEMRKTK